DHRPDDGLLVEGVADDESARPLGEARRELGVDRSLDEDPRPGGAALAVVREDHEHRGVERALEVGVGEYDERALAAELHRELLEPRRLDDAIAGPRRTGERDRADISVRDQ